MTLSSIPPPPRPPSSSTLILEGWTLLHRPATLDSVEFEQALSDLSATGRLAHRNINGNVYVRWLQ